jgi:hypothetical protein
MAEPTKEDAQLMIQLAQLGTDMIDPKARGWIWSGDFVSDPDEFRSKFPRGSDEYGYVNSMAAWHETLATLWKRGLISEELVFDWLWVPAMWERLKPLLLAEREEAGVSELWANFETMAEAQVGAAAPA